LPLIQDNHWLSISKWQFNVQFSPRLAGSTVKVIGGELLAQFPEMGDISKIVIIDYSILEEGYFF